MLPGLYPDEFHQALIEKTNQAFFAYEVFSGKFIYRSPCFKETFKLPEDDLEPARLQEMVHLEDQEYVAHGVRQLLHKGRVPVMEFRVLLPGQEEQWVCTNLSFLETEHGKTIIGHVEDITAQRQYNDHLKKFSNKKNSVLNILAHDLAGPLGIIHSLAGVLAERLEASATPEIRQLVGMISKNSLHGSVLIHEFMGQEFLESMQTEVVTRRVNLVEKCREAMDEYLGEKGNLIPKQFLFYSSSQEIFAHVDDLKLMQVLTNLISNALKFTPDGGTITVTLQEEKDHVLLQVADTGVGIPEKYHATLFDKFTEARRPGLKGEPSIGLGMSICKTIVEWHRGKIWFESNEHHGTTFYLRIPKNEVTHQ
ncbi:MAG: ATP-binding protein [Rufibacter sp.]